MSKHRPGELGYKARGTLKDMPSAGAFCGWDFLLRLVECADYLVDKALIATLFETGGRISEVLTLTKDNFDLDTHPDLIIIRNMQVKKRYKKVGVTEDGKWKTIPMKDFRTFPIAKKEPLVPYMLDYLGVSKGKTLFNFNRVTAFRKIRSVGKKLNTPIPGAEINSSLLYAHLFRAERASQLADEYGLNKWELEVFFGWHKKKEDMYERYARMSWRRLAERMGIGV